MDNFHSYASKQHYKLLLLSYFLSKVSAWHLEYCEDIAPTYFQISHSITSIVYFVIACSILLHSIQYFLWFVVDWFWIIYNIIFFSFLKYTTMVLWMICSNWRCNCSCKKEYFLCFFANNLFLLFAFSQLVTHDFKIMMNTPSLDNNWWFLVDIVFVCNWHLQSSFDASHVSRATCFLQIVGQLWNICCGSVVFDLSWKLEWNSIDWRLIKYFNAIVNSNQVVWCRHWVVWYWNDSWIIYLFQSFAFQFRH